MQMNASKPLYRSVTDRKVAGVAAGTASYLGVDVSLARVLWLVLAVFTGGAFGIVYLIMWIVVPDEPVAAPAAPSATTGSDGDPPTDADPAAPPVAASAPAAVATSSGPSAGLVIGALLILLGSWFLIRQILPEIRFDWLWPVGLVVVGLIILLAALRRPG
jgi:phage shock protein C